jgi:hypothetical protein
MLEIGTNLARVLIPFAIAIGVIGFSIWLATR